MISKVWIFLRIYFDYQASQRPFDGPVGTPTSPQAVRSCARAPEGDLRTCASPGLYLFFVWAPVTDRAPLEGRR